MRKHLFSFLLIFLCMDVAAQVGDYRNVFSVGIGGGAVLNTVGFQPKVVQNMHKGYTAGIGVRYTCEKYFSTLCAVQGEVNITQLGWSEDIKTIDGYDVINPATGVREEYTRDQTYIQIPLMAHLSWGKEKKGVNAFINLGPQLGFNISEHTSKNYDTPYAGSSSTDDRVSATIAQEEMPIEHTLDYGIVLGAGIEVALARAGRINLEGRYYYGLGNIYGDSKRDYFGISNHNTIFIKLSYFYDL